jgi:hypothetical protein
MSDSKVFMFPENGYNNNGGFGLGGWGGGILGFILGILLGNNGLFGGFGGNGGMAYGLANQMNNNNNTDLVMNAINGTDSDVRLLATTLNADINEVTGAIHQVQNAIQQVGAQNGMGFLQVTNALQSGNAALSRQLCECCCENRLLTTQQGYEGRIQTIEQTNALQNTINSNGRSITDAIADLQTNMTREFCDVREREMQSKIDTLTANNTLLRGQIDNAAQTAQFAAMLAPIQNQVNTIANKQPNTVPVQWPNIQAVNTTPSVWGYGWNNGWGSNSFWN